LTAEATNGRPLSRPFAFLIALAAIYTTGLCIVAVHAVIPAFEQTSVLWTILFGLMLTWWIYADRGARDFKLPFEFEYFVLFAWPVVVPYYLYRRSRWRGLLFGLGIWGLYYVPYVVSVLVYATQPLRSSR
jgi:hypothetical protein